MDLKKTMNGYFERTQLPAEISPEKMTPVIIKKDVKSESAEKQPVPAKAEQPAPAKAEQPAPTKVEQPAPAKAEQSAPAKVEQPAPPKTEQPTPPKAEQPTPPAESKPVPEIGASAFIKIVRHHRITGREFLNLLGNSKISNKAYQEIENSKGLTVKRLIEILEESSLTREDYEKLIIAVQQTAAARDKAKADQSEPVQPQAPQAEEKPAEKAEPAAEEHPAKAKEEQTKELPKTEKAPVNIKPEDEPSDEPDDEDEEDEEEEKKPLSTKKLFIIIAVAAIVLIALSFVIRYVATGSFLPGENGGASSQNLDESGLFAAMNGLPVSTQPAFTRNAAYTAGTPYKESDVTDRVMKGDRFVFCDKDTVYILRCSDGVMQQLDSRSYGEDVKLLGLLDTEKGVAVISETLKEGIANASEGDDSPAAEIAASRYETVVELLDGELPENRQNISLYKFSGRCAGAWTESGKAIFALWEGLADGANGSDGNSFMPYVTAPDNNPSYCSAENVFIGSTPANAGFVTVFSLDVQSGSVSCATAAGSEGQLVYGQGTDIFVFQGNTLLRYDVSGNVTLKDSCTVTGIAAGFSAVRKDEDGIKVTALDNGSAVLNVLDNDLNSVMTVNGIGGGELAATCFNGGETYIVDASGKAYGIDAEGKTMEESTVEVTAGSTAAYNDKMNIRISPSGDAGQRTGLVLSAVSPTGEVLSTLEINSGTVADNAKDEYISSPAETDSTAIGIDAEKGVIAVPVTYFDGVSQVERFFICNISGEGELTYKGSIIEYDRNSSKLFALIQDDIITAVMSGGRIISADPADCSVIAYVNIHRSEEIYSYQA